MIKVFSGLLLGLSLSLSVLAQAGEITVRDAWSRATAPGQDAAMVDFTISSPEVARLVGFECGICRAAELHSMTHENGMMKMRQVDAIELPAGKAVNLGASGYHLMLIGLKHPLQAGEQVTLTLKVRSADGQERKVTVNAEVRPINAAKSAHDEDGMHHHH